MDMNTISNVAATTTTYATAKENVKAKADNAKVTDTGVVYEKSSETKPKAGYSINKLLLS